MAAATQHQTYTFDYSTIHSPYKLEVKVDDDGVMTALLTQEIASRQFSQRIPMSKIFSSKNQPSSQPRVVSHVEVSPVSDKSAERRRALLASAINFKHTDGVCPSVVTDTIDCEIGGHTHPMYFATQILLH